MGSDIDSPLKISSKRLSLAPGESSELDIFIKNDTAMLDVYNIGIRGDHPDWVSITTSSVSIFPGDHSNSNLIFRVPKSPLSTSGRHEFNIDLETLRNGAHVSTVNVVLDISTYHETEVKVSLSEPNTNLRMFEFQIYNAGNSIITYEFTPDDDNRQCDVEITPSTILIPPNETNSFSGSVRIKKGERPFIGTRRKYEPILKLQCDQKDGAPITLQVPFRITPLIEFWVLGGLFVISTLFVVLLFFLVSQDI
jgi:hypothetical protein